MPGSRGPQPSVTGHLFATFLQKMVQTGDAHIAVWQGRWQTVVKRLQEHSRLYQLKVMHHLRSRLFAKQMFYLLSSICFTYVLPIFEKNPKRSFPYVFIYIINVGWVWMVCWQNTNVLLWNKKRWDPFYLGSIWVCLRPILFVWGPFRVHFI